MEIVKGCVVKSISGRDAQRFYLVVKIEDGFVWIADGKVRPLERPEKPQASAYNQYAGSGGKFCDEQSIEAAAAFL